LGSVKDLEIIKSPDENTVGIGRFHFSDRYSVFDWGEMPDLILYKGASIALLSAYFFERLKEIGIKNHYIGMLENGIIKQYQDLKDITNVMEIQLLRVIKPLQKDNKYDYSIFKEIKGNFLIPLEVIYRNALPEGSSLLKRLNKKEVTLEELNLNKMPKPNDRFDPPIIELSTKLEITDRYISWKEALEMVPFKEEEIQKLRCIVLDINKLITEEFSKINLFNEDGKIELGFTPDREFIVIDVIGTLDECRFTYKGIPVSKEIARIYYRKTQWYAQIEEAKKKNRINWNLIVKKNPPSLPPRLKELLSLIYRACTNEVTEKKWFKNVPPLKDLLDEIIEYI